MKETKQEESLRHILKSEPDFKLSADFSQRVMKTLTISKSRKKSNLIFLGSMGFLLLAITVIGAVFYLFGPDGFQAMGKFIYWTFTIIMVVGIVQLLDARFVSKDRLSEMI